PTLKPEAEVLSAFESLGKNPTKDQLKEFVNSYFGDENSLLSPAPLAEWKANPKFFDGVSDKYIKGFASAVNTIWKDLVRVQNKTGLCDGCVTSMLDVDGEFVVPGGRFREFYYWDTYFTLEGLLASELFETSKGMIQILLNSVEKNGFVPNGARIYYLDRSQPPLLAHMVELYYRKTNDIEFVVKALPILIKEHQYWVDNHMIKFVFPSCNDKTFDMFRYNVDVETPRPEGYAVDYYTVNNATSDLVKQKLLYAELAAGAESGHDYSARWASNTSAVSPEILYSLRVSETIPSDLNAIMYNNQRIIADLSRLISTSSAYSTSSKQYSDISDKFNALKDETFRNIMFLLYDDKTGLFRDYSVDNSDFTNVISAANVWPYWYFADKVDQESMNKAFSFVAEVLSKNPGGFPSTFLDTGLQWDFPDVWPPHQYAIIKGLQLGANTARPSNSTQAAIYDKLAFDLSSTFVGTAYCTWYSTGGSIPGILDKIPGIVDNGHIFEKFNATSFGASAGGGEYTVQSGFGWTNGVLFWALENYGDKIVRPSCPSY
ncbi:hypothetical protein BB560_005148, partial [Smittium megazygosporum]